MMYLKFSKDQENRSKKKTKWDRQQEKTKMCKRQMENIQLKLTQTWFQRKNEYRRKIKALIMS